MNKEFLIHGQKLQDLNISSSWTLSYMMVKFIVANIIMRVLRILLCALVGLFRYPFLTKKKFGFIE